jgi:hypothetical protein
MEDFLWQVAGVHGALANDNYNRAEDGTHFVRHLNDKIDSIKTQATEAVIHRDPMAGLGLAPRLLLRGPDGEPSGASVLTAELSKHVLASFDARIEALRAAVAEKAKTIDELALFSRWAWLGDSSSGPILDIIMIRSEADYDEHWPGSEFAPTGLIIRIDRVTGAATPVFETPSLDELKQWPHGLVALEANKEIQGFFIEALALAQSFESHLPRRKPSQAKKRPSPHALHR